MNTVDWLSVFSGLSAEFDIARTRVHHVCISWVRFPYDECCACNLLLNCSVVTVCCRVAECVIVTDWLCAFQSAHTFVKMPFIYSMPS